MINFILYFIISPVFAQEAQNFEVLDSDKIKVQCFNGKFQMIEDPSIQGIKVSAKTVNGKTGLSGKKIKVEKKEWGVEIACEISTSEYSKLSVKGNKEEGVLDSFEITVRGKSLPAEINWKWGDVLLKGWSKSSQILLESGKLQARGCNSDLKLNLIEGLLSVSEHKGRVNIESFDSKIGIETMEGPLYVSNFMGITRVNKVIGDLKFNSRKGTVSVTESEGTLNFINDLGKTEIAKFKGNIEGNSDQGNVEARLMDPAQIKIKSKTGQLDIVAPRSSGARVDIVIGDGQYKVPNNLKTEYLSNLRSIRGELQGREKGLISVRSETGRVFLRTN